MTADYLHIHYECPHHHCQFHPRCAPCLEGQSFSKKLQQSCLTVFIFFVKEYYQLIYIQLSTNYKYNIYYVSTVIFSISSSCPYSSCSGLVFDCIVAAISKPSLFESKLFGKQQQHK